LPIFRIGIFPLPHDRAKLQARINLSEPGLEARPLSALQARKKKHRRGAEKLALEVGAPLSTESSVTRFGRQLTICG
jgi:hypothetical protein